MILNALVGYYERALNDPEIDLAPFGFEWKAIPFVVVLDRQGNLLSVEDTRSTVAQKGRAFLVTQSEKRTVEVVPNLLWDTAEYALAMPREGDPEKTARKHAAFVERVASLAIDDDGVSALKWFLENADAVTSARELVVGDNPNVAFRIDDDSPDMLVCNRPGVRAAIDERRDPDGVQGFCPISGRSDRIARLHPSIKGVRGAQSSGASLVSFNLSAFNSFGKSQGENAPIGETAVFQYSTVLNTLLKPGSRNVARVGDATMVYWSARATPLETQFPLFFSEPPPDSPNAGIDAVRELYAAVQQGRYVGDDADQAFYVLGLAPNAARISVRFWVEATVGEMAERIVQHFRDLDIDRASFDREALPLWLLLASTAIQGKSDRVPPNLAGATTQAILSDAEYPAVLLSAAIRRVRAEQAIPHPRAALIKACLTRHYRMTNRKELAVSLDVERPETAYHLGRLFAALERVQGAAQGNLNASIRDRFFASASSTPATVFPILIRLSRHHLGKLDSSTWANKLVGEIMDRIEAFPLRLPLQEQGLFAIGYYHQQQSHFKAKE